MAHVSADRASQHAWALRTHGGSRTPLPRISSAAVAWAPSVGAAAAASGAASHPSSSAATEVKR
eukprot:scaffold115001_cov69-Phaeocystis_antarctica.AAC.5